MTTAATSSDAARGNVAMNIAGAVVAVLMRGHNARESAEVFGSKFHAELVGFFYGQAPFGHVLWVE